MIERYAVVASRIRQELTDIERVVSRVERAVAAADQHAADSDLYLDAAALNLHDFYAGLERVFEQIAANVDRSVPSGQNWHRELVRQMTTDIPHVRPPVLSRDTGQKVDEYLRFRHVVRNIYTFDLEPERVQHLAVHLRSVLEQVQAELHTFADSLDGLAQTE